MLKHFTIDSVKVPFRDGQTIMDAAMEAGVYIPHLCHNPEFTPHGSCRLCTVKQNGRAVAACTTPAIDGAAVENRTEELQADRRGLLQLLFVEGNHMCPGCVKTGNCQLQAVAYYCGMLAPEFVHFYPLRALDASHPDYLIDRDRCILCELCVRASRDFDGKSVFAVSGRGIGSHIVVNAASGKLGDTDFDAADRAAHVCPVGAIMPKHRGYETPIGRRLYDRKPVSMAGDVFDHERT